MKKEELLSTFGLADEKFVAEASTSSVSAHITRARSRFIALAACLALVFLIGMGGGIYYTVDAIRYNDAVSYLTQHGYSVDGLTKTEVLEKYNSIIKDGTSSALTASGEVISTHSQTDSEGPSSDSSSQTSDVSSSPSFNCRHTNKITVGKKAPTCAEPGESGETVCADCGFKLLPSHQIAPTGEHSFDDRDVCTVCGFVFKTEGHIVCELNKSGTSYTVIDFEGLSIKPAQNPFLDLVVPDTYNGLPITAIGDNAFDSITQGLRSISLPDTVTYIGDRVFLSSSITHIELPRDLTYIGEYAFAHSAVKTVDFNDKLEYIADSAFQNSKITVANIPDSVTHLGSNCFADCYYLKELTLPKYITELPSYLVTQAKITKLVIPEGVVTVRKYTVSDCVALKELYLPSTLKTIEHHAFWSYSPDWYIKDFHIVSLEHYLSLNIEGGVDLLASDSMLYVDGQPLGFDNTFVYPGTVTGSLEINGRCLGRYFNKLIIADGVTEIPDGMFSNWQNLTSVEFGKDVTTINYGAFSGCTSLTEIVIPDTVEYIGVYAFMGCEDLTSITIPPSVKKIDRAAFRGCENLKNVYITDMEAFENIEFVYASDPLQPEKENETSNPLYYGATLYLNGVPVE